jgi:peroxiredoxin
VLINNAAVAAAISVSDLAGAKPELPAEERLGGLLRADQAPLAPHLRCLEIAMTLLSPGDQFPVLSLTPPGGNILALPGALAGGFGVVLFYRGSWCPYCNAQLRAFQRAAAGLAEVGAKVVALSVDDEATTRELIARHGLTFPVGHSADARAIAQATGAFLNEDPLYVQSTGFVLDPAGRVVVSVYSSGAIGRLVPEDVVGLIRYLREHAESATSA